MDCLKGAENFDTADYIYQDIFVNAKLKGGATVCVKPLSLAPVDP